MHNEIVSSNISGLPAKISGMPHTGAPKGTFCSFHFHDEVEILFVSSGVMRFSFNETQVDVCAGEGIFVNRRVPHSTMSLADNTKDTLFQLNIEKLLKMEHHHMNRYLSLIFSGNENEFYVFKKDSEAGKEIFDYITKIRKEREEQKKSFGTYIKGQLFLILGALYRHEILNDIELKYDSEGISKIYKALVFVDKNYALQISLEEISDVVNMNPSYFCRVFKKVTGKTLMEYINYVRVWKAENLLTSTEKSILDISVETGFSSVSYFNRVFKKSKGTSPAVYRKIKYLK